MSAMDEKRIPINFRPQVEEKSHKTKLLLEKVESLFKSLPKKVRLSLKEEVQKTHRSGIIEVFHRFPLEDVVWGLKLNLCSETSSSIGLHKTDISGNMINWCDVTNKAQLYQLLIDEPKQQELLFIVGVILLDRVEKAFDELFYREVDRLDPDIVELSRTLRAQREKTAKLTNELTKRETEIAELKSKNNDLRRGIGRSIEGLEKSTKALENTKAFLGKSKTIKQIRENIEFIISDLEQTRHVNRLR